MLSLPVFLYGIVACRCFLLLKQSKAIAGKGYLIYIPSLLLLFALTSNGNHIPYPLMHNGLVLPSAIGMILGLAVGDGYLCKLLSNRIFVFLGKASYAEYLLHFPLRAAFESLGCSWTPFEQAAYFGSVLVISAFVFHFYEEIFQRKLRHLLLSRTIPRAAEGVVLPVQLKPDPNDPLAARRVV